MKSINLKSMKKRRLNIIFPIYPNDLKAKIYRLKNSKYDKEGDFFNEIYNFEDTSCKISP